MFLRLLMLVSMACCLTGCDRGVDVAAEQVPDEPVAEGRYGLILLTHDFAEVGVAVSAQLLHYQHQTRSSALHALALPEQAWLVADRPTPGECRTVDASAAPLGDAASIDLLDAGTLRVTPPEPLDVPLRLEARDFPRLLFSVSGVVYDADAPEQLPYLARGRYRVEAAGAEVGPFVGTVDAPGPVRLDVVDLDDGGLHLEWLGGGPATVTLSRDRGSSTLGLQCTSGTEGRFDFSIGLLRALGPGEAQLTVARVSTAPLSVPTIADADLMFVSRDTVDLLVPDPAQGEGLR